VVRQSGLLTGSRWLRVLVTAVALVGLSVAAPAARAAAGTVVQTPPVGSHPAVLGSPNSGNLAVFFNSNGTLEENFYTVASNTWSGPMALPGRGISAFDSPAAVGNPNGGNMEVFYTVSGTLMYDFYLVASNTWAGPFQVSSDIVGDPTVVGNPNGGNTAVFWRDSHNHLNEDFYFVASNTWSGAFLIASAIDDSPVAIGDPDGGNIAVFYTSNGALMESFYLVSQNSWNSPFTIATQVKGPAAVLGSPNSGNIAVFYTALISGTNQLREVFYTVATNSWGGPYTLPGTPANGPVAAIGSPNGGNIAVFFDNTASGILAQDLYQVSTNSWTGAISIGGQIDVPAQPAAVGDAGGGNRAVFFTDGASGQQTSLALNYFFGGTGVWSGPMLIGGKIT
jgi:hypothetical protein